MASILYQYSVLVVSEPYQDPPNWGHPDPASSSGLINPRAVELPANERIRVYTEAQGRGMGNGNSSSMRNRHRHMQEATYSILDIEWLVWRARLAGSQPLRQGSR